MRAWIWMYLVTFSPRQFNQMSFYSTEYGQGEFQVKENSTRVTDFLLKLLLFDFLFFSLLWNHKMKWKLRCQFFCSLLFLTCAFGSVKLVASYMPHVVIQIGHCTNPRNTHWPTPLCECQSLELCSVHQVSRNFTGF